MTNQAANPIVRSKLLASACLCFAGLSAAQGRQWTVTYNIDQQLAEAAIPDPERRAAMQGAFDRAKTRMEKFLSGSTGSVQINVRWENVLGAGIAADATASEVHSVTVSVARDRLINQASADGEPASEVALYEAMPATQIPFRHTEDVLQATLIGIPNALNKHLNFRPTTNATDGTMRLTPESDTVKWQFFRKTGNQLAGREVLEAVVFHETIHLLGFLTVADRASPPTGLTSWDIFRLPDGAAPLTDIAFTTAVRELRPTVEASAVTALNSNTRVYPLSRGNRAGGDGNQGSHWRAFTRLTPPVAVGVMDPSASGAVQNSLQDKIHLRSDIEALDVMGWNANPNAVSYDNAGAIDLLTPLAAAQIRSGTDIVFSWTATSFADISFFVYPGTQIIDDNPIRVFDGMSNSTTSVTLSGATSLPPGEYTWAVVGSTDIGYVSSEDRRLTIIGGCDSVDFNNDGVFPDDADLSDFLLVLGGGTCANCNDLDFNNDGVFPEEADFQAFLLVFGGGTC